MKFQSKEEVIAYATLLGATTPWGKQHGNKYENTTMDSFWIDLETTRSHSDVHELMFMLTNMGYYCYLVSDPDLISAAPVTIFINTYEPGNKGSIYIPYWPKKD